MKNTIKVLEGLYRSVLKQESDNFFYLCIADYVDYCSHSLQIKKIIGKINKDNLKKEINAKNKLELASIRLFKEIIKKIENRKIRINKKIANAIRYFEFELSCLSESLSVSRAEKLYLALDTLVHLLSKPDISKEFYELKEYMSFVFESKDLRHKLNYSILVSQKHLFFLRDLIRKSKTLFGEAIEGKYDILGIDELDVEILFDEVDIILGNTKEILGYEKKYFRREVFVGHLTRLHNYIVEKLYNPQIVSEKQLQFLPDQSELLINQYRVKISKSRNTFPHTLLCFVFRGGRKLGKQLFFSETAGHINDNDYENRLFGWKRYYNACEKINKIVIMTTNGNIKKFLIYTTKYFHINDEYLAKK